MDIQSALKQIAYKNLFKRWLESHQQNPPQGFNNVQSQRGMPQNYFLKPEDMMRALNAYSPFDLYLKPNSYPQRLDYPTSAFNIDNRIGKLGIPSAILMASQSPKNQLSQLMSVANSAQMNYNDIPFQYRNNVPQAIYSHEVAHYNDPRLNPMANNYGFMMREGLQGNVAGREMPAMQAESDFWDRLRIYINNGGKL